MKAGGQKPWSVTAIFEVCETYWQMTRRLKNVGSSHYECEGKLDLRSFDIGYGRAQNNATIRYSRKKVEIKRGGQSEEKQRFCFSRAGRAKILQEGLPLSSAVYKAGGDLRRESQQYSSEEKEEARDPDPDVEVRLDS